MARRWRRRRSTYRGNQAAQEDLQAQQSVAAPAEEKEESWGDISEEDQKFFERVLGITDEDLQKQTTDWYQTTEGNCVTVAVAKAAADALGTDVFTSLEKTSSGLKIGLRDGAEVEVSATELTAARSASDFKGRDEDALSFGTVIYAAVAKRALEEKHEGARNYQDALRSLNNGERVSHVIDLAGLEDHSKRVSTSDLDGQDAVVAYSQKHAIYVDKTSEGHVSDHYGRGVQYNRTDTNSSGRRGWRRRSGSSNAIVGAYAIQGLPKDEESQRQ